MDKGVEYLNGIKHGISEEYFENGQIKRKGQNSNGSPIGQWENFNIDGTFNSNEDFIDGKIKDGSSNI